MSHDDFKAKMTVLSNRDQIVASMRAMIGKIGQARCHELIDSVPVEHGRALLHTLSPNEWKFIAGLILLGATDLTPPE